MTLRSFFAYILRGILGLLSLILHTLSCALFTMLFGLMTVVFLDTAKQSYAGGIPGYMDILWLIGAFIGLFLTTAAIAVGLRPSFQRPLNRWLEKDGWFWVVSIGGFYFALLWIGHGLGRTIPLACAVGWSFGCFGQWMSILVAMIVILVIALFWAFAVLIGPALERADAIERELYDY